MKTAISLPDGLFALAEKFAAARGMSRSRLYATALHEYLRNHGRDDLTRRIDAVCETVDTSLPPDLSRTARDRLAENEW